MLVDCQKTVKKGTFYNIFISFFNNSFQYMI